jgi:hypothetical protein
MAALSTSPPARPRRLQLLHPTTSKPAATASGSPAPPNGGASSSSGTWRTRSPRSHNPVWAAPEPAALPVRPFNALTIPNELCAVGENSLCAFSVA